MVLLQLEKCMWEKDVQQIRYPHLGIQVVFERALLIKYDIGFMFIINN